MWGGSRFVALDSDLDKSMTSSMDLYHLPTSSWEGRPTNGNPPLRASGYSSAAIGNNIYFFGGDRGGSYRNSVHCFSVDSFNWRELSPSSSDRGPIMKAYCGMISAHFDGEHYLVIIGGIGSSINTSKQPDAKYSARGRCNEIHYYRISSESVRSFAVNSQQDQWISPVVTGDRPPPIYSFTLTPVTNNTAAMFGGHIDNGASNKLYMISFTKTTVINLPVNVTNRYWHSLSVWNVTPTTDWIIEFGGDSSYTDTAVIELRYTSDNDWSTSVIPLDQYQDQLRRRILSDWENLGIDKQLQMFQNRLQLEREREFYQEQLQREIKEKEQIQQDQDKEQQQLLQEKATLTQQLDDATTLLEQAEKDKSFLELEVYEKLKAKDADNEGYISKILEEKKQVEEKKQIIIEDYEKLKLKVAKLLEQKEEQYFKEKQIIIDNNQNLKTNISEKDKVIAKLTSQVHVEEKQITADLKEKELYIAKLVKERQERVLKQPIKETSSIGLQFNYLIPSMDNLDCLSDVQVAEKKLFLVQGEKPQLINWEKYGLRIGVQEDTLLPTNTFEVAVAALVGGQFVFPKNTVLVSAVYAVSVSKALLKPLQVEIEHCIDLRGRPGLTRFLKFAIAPVSTPSLPYQFSVVEGGEFKPDSWYGSIQRKEFCLVAIVGEKFLSKSSTNGDESEEEEQEEQAEEETEEEVEDGDSDSSSYSDKTKDPPGGSSVGQGESTSNEGVEEKGETGGQPLHEEGNEEQKNRGVGESKNHKEEEATALMPCTEIGSDFNIDSNTSEQVNATEEEKLEGDTSIDPVDDGKNLRVEENTEPQPQEQTAVGAGSTGVEEAATYAGLVYYEKKEAEDLVTFTVAKKLSALLEFIEKKHVQAEIGQYVYFSFIPFYSYIELKFDAPQDEPFTGWSIKPHIKPCRLRRCDVDNFGDANYPLPPCCLVSVYGSPGAVPSLHYSVPLDGVADPVTLFIHRSLRTAPPPPSTNPTTSSSSNVVHESTSVSSTGGTSPSATVDVNKVKKVINDVLVSHYADLNSLPKKSLTGLVNQLYAAKLISNEVREAPSMKECIDELKASLSFMRKLPQVQEHCQKFLSSFIAVRGSYANAAIALGEDWIEAIRNELGFDFNIDIDA
uniref:Uncharacterized protein n=1 Tax=Amphimedon queenslandica TaxID=400682 RepID=A0A1X7UXY0_AMPQE